MQQLSPIDKAALANRPALIKQLLEIVPEECVIDDDASLRVYETDALTAYRQVPMLVVLPETTAQVAAVLKLCSRLNIKVVPRGAGTSLSGGALPLADGIVLGLGKFNKILDIDFANRCVVAQSGVTNLAITEAVKHKGFYYAPDPSSQIVCTIGGNVSENSGGVHCLKYGLTTNNVMGLEMVTMAGEILRIGGKYLDPAGYDLLGIITGSEGLLGVITEVTVRIIQEPQTARAMLLGFPSNETAGECVAGIISSGIIPAGMEMMDEFAIKAAEDFCHAGYPVDCPALVLTELDGPEGEVTELIEQVRGIAGIVMPASSESASRKKNERVSGPAEKRPFRPWGIFRLIIYCMDGTIPRRELSHVLSRMQEMSEQYGLRVANVFHAGDGNLHPLILFDANEPEELEKAEEFGADILRLCVEVGGVLSG